MPQQVRMWEITPQDSLVEIASPGIDLEKRLESWLESDISMLDPNLLVIGRQVHTDFGGVIDLLCMDSEGGLVVVELKRDQTPRDVTAQALDYASWAKDLPFARINAIAAGYSKLGGSLEDAFASRFDQQLPDTLNLNHRSLIVAERMDDSTERIVRYLSDLNVPVNIATVQHFKDSNGREMLAQVYLIEPEVAEAKTNSVSKRGGYGTVNGLQKVADDNGIGYLYRRVREGVKGIFSATAYQDAVGYSLRLNSGGTRVVMFISALSFNDEGGGIEFTVHADRFSRYLEISPDQLKSLLPKGHWETDLSNWIRSSPEEKRYALGLKGRFYTVEEVDQFIAGLRAAAEQ